MNFEKLDIRDAFFKSLHKLALKDKNLILITDDLDAFELRRFKKDFPKQFINIGVSEQNLIDVAAGLSSAGKKVFVFGISSYITMRCYEQIKFSVCSMDLPVTIIGLGCGFSFPFDGPTHHAVSDLAIMRLLPEMTIFNPSDSYSAFAAARVAYKNKGPVYIRLDKGISPPTYKNMNEVSMGGKILRALRKVNLISMGIMTFEGVRVADQLQKEGHGVGVVDIFRIKPINKVFISRVAKASEEIVILEENNKSGNLGTIVIEVLTDDQISKKIHRLSLPDKQLFKYGSRKWLQKLNGLDNKTLISRLRHICKNY